MKINQNISNEELREIAQKQNKSIEDVAAEYKHALKELEYSNNKLSKIIDDFHYVRFPNDITLNGYGKNNELNSKYLCFDNLENFSRLSQSDMAIVTGFGPTNSPTAGTLSLIFKALELQKQTGFYTHIIISELSALNSRQKPLTDLMRNAHQFITFIKKLGFDETNGEIRTHNFHDHARVFSLVASVLSTQDLLENREVTNDMYKRLALLGNDFSKMVSRAYTMSDMILPIVRDRKRGVIVPVGLEEHHHPHLARIVLSRLKQKTGGVDSLVPPDAEIGAIYGKLIGGLFPYVKMSKSIPDSSINVGDTIEDLQRKIIDCGERNEEVILQMMMLASNWTPNQLSEANQAFENRENNYEYWKKLKYDYLNFFVEVKNLWEESKYQGEIDVYKDLFSK